MQLLLRRVLYYGANHMFYDEYKRESSKIWALFFY